MTRTRWGKLRPVRAVLGGAGRDADRPCCSRCRTSASPASCVYFGVVYLLWGFAYTVCDVPLWGLIGSAFADPAARNRVVSNVRAFGAIALGHRDARHAAPSPHAAQLRRRDHRRGLVARGRSSSVVVGHGPLPARVLLRARDEDRRGSTRASPFRQLFGTLFRNTPLLLVLVGSVRRVRPVHRAGRRRGVRRDRLQRR